MHNQEHQEGHQAYKQPSGCSVPPPHKVMLPHKRLHGIFGRTEHACVRRLSVLSTRFSMRSPRASTCERHTHPSPACPLRHHTYCML